VILVFGFGNFLGLLVGGFGGSYMYTLDSRYPALLAGIMAIAGCFPMWILVNSVTQKTSSLAVFVVATAAGLASGVTGPIVKATLQNVTVPSTQGQAFALFTIFDDFGRGLGPVFVALLIRLFNGRRSAAFNIGISGWLACGACNLLMYFSVQHDEKNLSALAESETPSP
jgi:MFS-type transporter involved in bile tolerance (Atg22 family)